jgi:four helix bundle protein
MHVYSFEKLKIWTEIRELIKLVYELTSKFPNSEKFGLLNQMRRAIISVSSNLAEGTSRTSSKDQAHFTQIAYSSLLEVLSQLIVAFDLNFISEEEYFLIRNKIENLTPRISALRKSQLKTKPLNSKL